MVDLCWGLRSVPWGEHEAREVFQEEIRRCQQISAGPAFIVSWSPVDLGSPQTRIPLRPRSISDQGHVLSYSSFFFFSVFHAWVLKALLGNRYGHRALPPLIQEKVFISLLSTLSKDPEDAIELNRWYLKDDNAVPPTYILQPITAHFPDLRGENSVQREKAALCWRAKEARLLQILRTAAAAAETAGDITPDQRRGFSTSGQNI